MSNEIIIAMYNILAFGFPISRVVDDCATHDLKIKLFYVFSRYNEGYFYGWIISKILWLFHVNIPRAGLIRFYSVFWLKLVDK